jgi:N-acetylglucosamine malate deacetylase 1
MLYYFSIHLRIHPRPGFVLDITDAIEEKLAAIRCYESQFVTGRPQEFPTPLDDIRDRARYWGWTIHRPWGEPFASREEVGIASLTALR